MKILLGILGSLGVTTSVGAPMAVIYQNSEAMASEESIEGEIITNLIAEKRVTDNSLGGSASDVDENSRTIRWKEFNIDDDTHNKIDFENSVIGLDIKHGYGDNSASGNSNGWTVYEEFKIKRYFYSGEKEYNEDRHHGGSGRSTDHQWKYSLEVNGEGVTIWDWVWVWANGNWGNVANSVADINIKSVYFNFKLL